MAALMTDWLYQLKAHRELIMATVCYDQTVRDQLMAMGAAPIDR